MARVAKINDIDQLEDWLKTQDVQVSYALAARSALRCLPAVAAHLDQTKAREEEILFLNCLRATLIAGVASICLGSELGLLRGAAVAAYGALDFDLSGFESDVTIDVAAAGIESAAEAVLSETVEDFSFFAVSTVATFEVAEAAAFDDASGFENGAILSAAHLFSKKLWAADRQVPALFVANARFGVDAPNFWTFWWDWYEGMLHGKPVDWKLQLKIALIDDAIWDAGPEAVAREIERIRREMAGPAPLEREKLLTHVKHLLANPVMTESAALSAADTVERAIRAYKDEAPANCLPDGLEHLEDLPGHFRAIAKVVADPAASKGKEEELRREIENLHAKVVKLEQDLVEARSKTLKGVISTNAAEKLGTTLGNPVFYGGIAMGVGYFLGVTPSDMTFENLRGFIQELTSANAEAPVAPAQSLPHVHDI